MKLPVDHFRFIARWYDELLKRPAVDPLSELLAVGPGDRVLDAGGGTGRNTQALLAWGAQVTVFDLSSGMLHQAASRGLPAVRGSVTALPFPRASADRILIVDAFHHFVDPSPTIAQPAAARELLRVLRPGGRLVIEEPDIRQAPVMGIALGEKLLLMGSRFLSPAELIRLFEGLGASTVDRHYENATAWLVFSR